MRLTNTRRKFFHNITAMFVNYKTKFDIRNFFFLKKKNAYFLFLLEFRIEKLLKSEQA
jgi:hypothetical protein